MNISKILTNICLTFLAVIILLFTADITRAQQDSVPKKRLKVPTMVKGFIGGESHDNYVIRATKGKTLIVQISWQREDKNNANFTISRSANFFNGEPVKFGKESYGGKIWTGKIPSPSNYYIYVVAHPTAKYTLKVTTK